MELFKLINTTAGAEAVERLRKCSEVLSGACERENLTEKDISTLLGLETQCGIYEGLISEAGADDATKLSAFGEVLKDINHFCQLIEEEPLLVESEGSAT